MLEPPRISPNSRIRVPESLIVGAGSIIDDYCYISTRLIVGRGSHIASGCSIAGGRKFLCSIGDLCSLSSGVKIWCSSNDFVNDLIAIGEFVEMTPIQGDVEIGNYSGVGANSVVMPMNRLPEGTAVGALSFVPSNFPFEPWSVYAGIPIRRVGPRNRERIMRQIDALSFGSHPPD